MKARNFAVEAAAHRYGADKPVDADEQLEPSGGRRLPLCPAIAGCVDPRVVHAREAKER